MGDYRPDPDELDAKVAELRNWPGLLSKMPREALDSPLREMRLSAPELSVVQELQSSILHAEEGLKASTELAGEGRVQYPLAVYPLLRSSLENSAHAFWLLSAPTPKERIARLAAVEMVELRHHIRRGVDAGFDVRPYRAYQALLQQRLFELGVDTASLERVTWWEKMDALGRRTRPEKPVWLKALWSTLSAVSHGSGWGRSGVLNEYPDGSFGPSVRFINNSILMTALTVGHVHHEYEKCSGTSLSGRLPEFISDALLETKDAA